MIVIYAISTQQQKSKFVACNNKYCTYETMTEYGEFNLILDGLYDHVYLRNSLVIFNCHITNCRNSFFKQFLITYISKIVSNFLYLEKSSNILMYHS